MKKFVLLIMVLFALPVYSQVLTGSVEYTVNDAKIELQNNRPPVADILSQNNFIDLNHNENYSALLKGKTIMNDRILAIFSDGTYAVNYKKDLKHVWYYEIRTSLEFPYRSYKYGPDGELINMSLRVSKDETFIFSPFGELLGHWIGDNCYDENGNIIMTRKIMK